MLEAEQPWHNDNWLRTVVFCSLLGAAVILQRLTNSGRISEKKSLELCIVFGIAVLSSSFLLSANSVKYGDDLKYHLSRIEGIAQGLRDGQFPVIVYPEMVKENGYLNAMYPSMFLYIPAVLRLIGVSYSLAYKVFLIFINFATAFVMYFSMKSITRSGRAAVFAAAMYVFARYRLNNMLVRGALGETLAMIFLPLIIAGIYQIVFGDRKKWWILVIGITGVIQSHVLSTALYASIAAILLLIYAGRIIREKRYVSVGIAAGMSILLNAGFLIPFLVFYSKGNLDLGALTSFSSYWDYGVNPAYMFGIFRVFWEDGLVRDFALHLPMLCLLGSSVIYLICNNRKKSRTDGFLNCLFILSCILIFMSTNLFPYEKMRGIVFLDKFFSTLQFPWRFEGPAIGLLVMSGSIWLVQFDKLAKYTNPIIIALIAMILLDTSYWKLGWNENMAGERSAYVECTCADIIYCPDEYMVNGNRQFLDTYAMPEEDTVLRYSKVGTKIDAVYISNSTQHWIDLPLMNYIGYIAKDENGNKYDLETGDSGNIRLLLHSGGPHEIHLKYKEPLLFRITELTSIISLLVWIAVIYRRKVNRAAKSI